MRTKNLFYPLLAILILILGVACNRKKISSKDCAIIPIWKKIERLSEYPLSEIVDRIDYVKLETNSKSLLTQINHIDIHDDKIAISDSRKCILYSIEGKYIRTIGSKGRGEGEYTSINGFAFLPNKEELAIRNRKELIIYSLIGKFKQKIKLPHIFHDGIAYYVNSFIPVNDSTFLGYLPNGKGTLKFKAILFNRNGEIKHKYPNYIFFDRKKGYISSDDYHVNLHRFDNTILFKECMNDTLFYMKGIDLIPKYVFDLGMYSMPLSVRGTDFKSYLPTSENYIIIRNVFELSKYIFLECDLGKYSPISIKQTNQYNSNNTWGLFNKIDSSFTFIKPTNIKIYPTGIINNYDNGPNLYPQKVITGNTLLSWIDAYQLKAFVASEAFRNSTPNYPQKKKELERLANSLGEYDNPVLMLVKLKD